MKLEAVTHIKGKKKGPKIAIFSQVHGDEHAGDYAHKFLIDYFKKNPLEKGSIYLVEANYKAGKKNLRGIKYDMNRIFFRSKKDFPKDFDFDSYEYKRAMELMKFINKMDILLDIHSTSKSATPFSICFFPNKKTRDILSKMPIKYSINNFAKFLKGTTMNCVKRGKVGIVIECGKHTNKVTAQIAIKSAKVLLQELSLVNFGIRVSKNKPKEMRIIQRKLIKDHKTFNYSKNYKSFMLIDDYELIAEDCLGKYIAPKEKDMVILFPANIKSIRQGTNNDAYYIAKKV